jgi:hypothetical protein
MKQPKNWKMESSKKCKIVKKSLYDLDDLEDYADYSPLTEKVKENLFSLFYENLKKRSKKVLLKMATELQCYLTDYPYFDDDDDGFIHCYFNRKGSYLYDDDVFKKKGIWKIYLQVIKKIIIEKKG